MNPVHRSRVQHLIPTRDDDQTSGIEIQSTTMSRFAELRRIDAALSTRDQSELEWARRYATERLETAGLQHHLKHWRAILRKIEDREARVP